jgi:protein-tyrosine phosphatase
VTASLPSLDPDLRAALLQAAPNFRETAAGDMQPGVAYRTSQLTRLGDGAQAALRTLGVREVFDLRTQGERAAAPDTIEDTIRITVADVLADAPDSGATRLAALTGSGRAPVEEINAVIGDGAARNMMIATYQDMVRLGSARRAYAVFLRGVVAAEAPVAYHCTAGKDRTGWAAALLQMIAGVDRDEIASGYLASNDLFAPSTQGLVSRFAAAGGDAAGLEAVIRVELDYLQAAIDAMHSDFGSLEGYLEDGLALTHAEVTALRSRLLTG